MISDKLKELRTNAGLNQIEFAGRIGVSPSTYNFYEQGKQYPRADTIIKICQEFNASADWLLEISKVNKPKTVSDAFKLITAFSEGAGYIIANNYMVENMLEEKKERLSLCLLVMSDSNLVKLIKDYFEVKNLSKKTNLDMSLLNPWLESTLNKYDIALKGRIENQSLEKAVIHSLGNVSFEYEGLPFDV